MPGGDFRLCFKSVSGFYTGFINSSIDLSAAPARSAPVISDTGFNVWQPYSFSTQGVALAWETYYVPCLNDLDTISTLENVNIKLVDMGAISAATAAVLCEIQLVDEYNNPVLSPSLCLMGYSGGTDQIRFFVARKEVSGGATTYTAVSVERAMAKSATLRDPGFYLVAGTFAIGQTGVTYGVGIVSQFWNSSNVMIQCAGEIFLTNETGWKAVTTGHMPEEEEVDPTVGPPSEPGGYGPGGDGPAGGEGGPGPTFDYTSDNIGIPTMPPGISSLGFVNIYKCGIGALTALGATLFPDVSQSTDVWTAITALSDAIWNSKLIDYVVSIHMVPADVPAGSDEDIKIGTRTLMGIQGAKVSQDYVDVPLGSLKVDELYTNFVDYSACRARLYLPFYGFVPIKNEYWQSAELSITYRINVIDGSFIAFVKSNIKRHQQPMDSVIGQYSGCACIQCPTSGVSYASMFSGMVANGAGMGISMATGDVGKMARSALGVAQARQGEMQHSNPYNSSASVMGTRKPFLLIERAVSHFPKRYGKEKGYPLLVSKNLGSCRGFTIASNPVLDGIPATLAEKERIKTYLQSGVIIK